MDLYGSVAVIILPPVVIIGLLLWQPNFMLRSLWMNLTALVFGFAGTGAALANWGNQQAMYDAWWNLLSPLTSWNMVWMALAVCMSLYAFTKSRRALRPAKPRPAPPLAPRDIGVSPVNATITAPNLLAASFDITITGTINVYVSENVRAQCKAALESPLQDVVVTLDCTGGDNYHAHQIREWLNELVRAGKHVVIVATRECASASTVVLTSVPIENRFARKGTEFTVHNGTFGATDRQVPIDHWWSIEYREDLVERTLIDSDSLKRLFIAGGDYMFDTEEAIRLGLIAAVI